MAFLTHIESVIGPRLRVMEIHLETDAQVKAPPPCIVDDHIRDRVSCLERQFKAAHALIQLGDIVLQACVLALTSQHLDVGHVAPHFMFQLADVGTNGGKTT